METLGERLATARRRRMLTQTELANEAQVGVVTVSRLENDQGSNPRMSTVRRLADVLDVDASWLLFGEEEWTGKAAA